MEKLVMISKGMRTPVQAPAERRGAGGSSALKGQNSVETSLAEKDPPTLHSNKFMEFFHISKIARYLDENVKNRFLFVRKVFIQSGPTFSFVTRL